MRAIALETTGDLADAREALERAQQIEPQNPVAVYARAHLERRAGNADGAYQAFLEALRLLGASQHDREGGKPRPFLPSSLDALDRLPLIAPEQLAAIARRLLSSPVALTQQGLAEADWLSRRAAELEPELADVWLLRAMILFRPGEEAASNAAFAKALELGVDESCRYTDVLHTHSILLGNHLPYAEARRIFLSRAIPERDPRAPRRQLDLSAQYNAAFGERHTRYRNAFERQPEAAFPIGMQTIGGIDFDIRGKVPVERAVTRQPRPWILVAFPR